MLLPPECCICKELLKKDLCVEKNCGNIFHRDCFITWLTVKDTCPLCQTKCYKSDTLDIHYELIKGNLQINEENYLEKEKEELYEQLKKYENDLQEAQIENEQKTSQIFTLQNKTSVLEETLKGMEVKKLKLQMELNSSKATTDEYIKENYILKSQIQEYKKELQKMNVVNSYLENVSKDESNNIYLTLDLNALSEKEQIRVLLNYIKTIKESNKNYKVKVEELTKTIIEKNEQLFQKKTNSLQMNTSETTSDTEKEKEKNEINNIKIKTSNIRRLKRNGNVRSSRSIISRKIGNSDYNNSNNYSDNNINTFNDNNINNLNDSNGNNLNNSNANNLNNSNANNLNNSNVNNLNDNNINNLNDNDINNDNSFIDKNVSTCNNFGSNNTSGHPLSISYAGSVITNSSSHSPNKELNRENKSMKSADFMEFLDRKMNPYSPLKTSKDYTISLKSKNCKSIEIDLLRNKSVEGLFDDLLEDGNELIAAKCKSSNSSFFSSFETGSNKTPSPTHPNTDALFERINDTTPLRVDYTSFKSCGKKYKRQMKIIPERRKTTPSTPLKKLSSTNSSNSNTDAEDEAISNGRSLKPYVSGGLIKKKKINKRKTYSPQSTKITDFFKKT